MLPSLARLPVAPTGAGQEDLPPELVALVQVLVHSDDPCRELVHQCGINKRWAAPCRDGTLYEATNRRMGWYGTYGSLAAVQQHYRAFPIPAWAPPDTAKDYFLEACASLRQVQALGPSSMPGNPELSDAVSRLMGWYGAHGSLAAVQQHYALHPDPTGWTPPTTALAYALQAVYAMNHAAQYGIPGLPGTEDVFGQPGVATPPRPWFVPMVRSAIHSTQIGAGRDTIRWVPVNHPAYSELALEAVRKDDGGFEFVSSDHPDYATIAQVACDLNPHNFEDVAIAVPNYLEIALHVVPREPSMLKHVFYHRKDLYYEVARATVARDGEALRFVDGSLRARHTYMQPGWVSQVAPVGADQPPPPFSFLTPAAYVELARIAVEQNPDALRWVPPLRPEYEAIATHAQRARNALQRFGA